MSEYEVHGRFQSRDGWQRFERTVEAPNENVAKERTYATVGSQHARNRRQIEIDEIAGAGA
ncbi:50S ribosomal protein L18a [Halobacteriales archaeon SW_7_68_16]|nr:MAG: 50S ribosomal protein L18a [Halobacteriales archaeon SW_7_68_16]